MGRISLLLVLPLLVFAADLAHARSLTFESLDATIEVRADGTVEVIPADVAVDLPQPQFGIYWGAQMKLVPLPRLGIGDAVEIKTYMKGFLIAYLDELAQAEGSAGGGGGDAGDEKYIPPMRGHFYDVVYFHKNHPVKLRHYTVHAK